MTTEPGANVNTEPQVDPQVAELKTRADSLEKQTKSLQRELAKARASGDSFTAVLDEIRVNREGSAAIAEAIDKLAKAGELKDVDLSSTVAKLRAKPEPKNDAKERVSQQIVVAAQVAGIDQDSFDETWNSDPRFAEARAYWSGGNFEMAAAAFQGALARPAKKTFSEEEVQARVADEVAKSKRAAASTTATTPSGGERTIDREAFLKMNPEERSAHAKELRAALRK